MLRSQDSRKRRRVTSPTRAIGVKIWRRLEMAVAHFRGNSFRVPWDADSPIPVYRPVCVG
jgi:hypothetical protein